MLLNEKVEMITRTEDIDWNPDGKEMNDDEYYAAWPYKDMNGWLLDIGDNIKLVGYDEPWDRMTIIGFSLDGKSVYTNTGIELPIKKVLWVA